MHIVLINDINRHKALKCDSHVVGRSFTLNFFRDKR